jgi:biopolymer transport protein ExbD
MHFRNQEEEDYRMEMTPMIDVVFLLLIFFMVSTSFVDFTKRMDISLPESEAAVKATKRKIFTIEMGIEGKINLNGRPATFENLAGLLEEETRDVMEKSVIIKADKGLPYGGVVKVMGIVKARNITDISIAVR